MCFIPRTQGAQQSSELPFWARPRASLSPESWEGSLPSLFGTWANQVWHKCDRAGSNGIGIESSSWEQVLICAAAHLPKSFFSEKRPELHDNIKEVQPMDICDPLQEVMGRTLLHLNQHLHQPGLAALQEAQSQLLQHSMWRCQCRPSMQSEISATCAVNQPQDMRPQADPSSTICSVFKTHAAL